MKKKASKYPIPIGEWSEDDRPREKLLKYGEHTPCNVYPACPACPVESPAGSPQSGIQQGKHCSRYAPHILRAFPAAGHLLTIHVLV